MLCGTKFSLCFSLAFLKCHLFSDANDIVDSNYGFSVLDANSVEFLLNNAPEAAKWLKDNSDFSFEENHHSDRSFWVVSKHDCIVGYPNIESPNFPHVLLFFQHIYYAFYECMIKESTLSNIQQYGCFIFRVRILSLSCSLEV